MLGLVALNGLQHQSHILDGGIPVFDEFGVAFNDMAIKFQNTDICKLKATLRTGPIAKVFGMENFVRGILRLLLLMPADDTGQYQPLDKRPCLGQINAKPPGEHIKAEWRFFYELTRLHCGFSCVVASPWFSS